VEDPAAQGGGLRPVAGPGEEVAVDALDLGVAELGEGLTVAGGGAGEQRALARELGGYVAAAAGAGGRLGVRWTLGWRCHRGAFSG
jgi:hypothetical protein